MAAGRYQLQPAVHSKERDAPVQSNRTLAVLKGLFRWSVQKGILKESPAAALQAKRARGERVGNVPLGFRDEGGRLVADTSEQAVLTEVRALAARGLGLAEIARRMQAGPRRIRGNVWHPETVRRILAA